jgi:hypothetical protein
MRAVSQSLGAPTPSIAFMAYTGVRRDEALTIGLGRSDLEGGFVTIRRSLSDTKSSLAFKSTKNGKSRRISIAPELVSILSERRLIQKQERSAMGGTYLNGDLALRGPTVRRFARGTSARHFRIWSKGRGSDDASKRAIRNLGRRLSGITCRGTNSRCGVGRWYDRETKAPLSLWRIDADEGKRDAAALRLRSRNAAIAKAATAGSAF